MTYDDKPMKCTTLLDLSETKDEFKTSFVENMPDFRAHQDRVNTQNINFRLLKQQLKPEEVKIQMDFAENYVCHYKKEVAAAYFSNDNDNDNDNDFIHFLDMRHRK